MHWGTVLGHEEVGAGLEGDKVPVTVIVSGTLVAPATHLVQIVEVEVSTTVETVVVGTRIVDPPEVTVLVTGQVVTVV
jgi:hypothetical protein